MEILAFVAVLTVQGIALVTVAGIALNSRP